jgi:hypothetical protein
MQRQRAGLMTAMDDEILELLYSSGLALSPVIIAYNLDKSRECVANRIKLPSVFN